MKKNQKLNNRYWRTINFYLLLATFSLFAVASVSAQTMIYNNGNIATGQVSKSGVAAPGDSQWAEVQNDLGNTTESNSTSGSTCSANTGGNLFRLADDFTVPAGQTWTINEVLAYAYQTGSTGNPFVSGVVQIWNGRPGDTGSTVIFGDVTTNRLASSVDTKIFRIFNSAVPTTANPPGTTRRVWENHLTVSPALALSAGTYWVDFQFQNAAMGSLFCPTVTEEGTRTLPGANGRQFVNTPGSTPPVLDTWQDVIDVGAPASAPDVNLGIPFKLVGSRVAGSTPIFPTSREFDFGGDNKADPAVVRSEGSNNSSTWYILSNGTPMATIFGLAVGQVGGDVAVPADYDGDGKTDIAVWRTGTQAYYYIMQSGNSTFRSEPFGQTGDNPRVVGDYDGDGKADPAVFRPEAQAFFAYRGSLNNPSNNISVQFFGTTGDIPIPGDFDGDRKADFHVARNNGGNYTHYQMLSTNGFKAFIYGLSTDTLVPGQFDNDTKTDIAAVRNVSGFYRWFILRSQTNLTKTVDFGSVATDTLVPGDYDGDLETDIAVRRNGAPANYLVLNSNRGPVNYFWGLNTDYPVANFDIF